MNAATEFDVFVSYNSLDHAAVERIAQALKDRGLTVFLDRWELVLGRPWPEALEEHLSRCRSAAVVLGPSGMGPWQQRERNLALDRQAKDTAFGVIPVILPNADPALGFLSLNTWLDLSREVDDPDSMDFLAAAVRGQPPAALLERTREAAARICPYRGLEVFREEDAPLFFGREAFTKDLCEAVAAQSLVAVVGRSGSGKSSVVRAGLVPNLRRPDGDSVWEIATLVPGQQPLHAIAGALLPLLETEMTETDRLIEVNKQASHLADGDLRLHQVVNRILEKQPGTDRLLLVIDQWEELYTHKTDDEKAEHKRNVTRFIDELLTATEAAPLTLVITLRADFYGDALLHRALADRLRGAVVNLGPMTREELERAVTKPAEKVGLSFDTGLVDSLLDDVGDEPGNLPLMEFSLKALWEARRGNRLRYDIYKDMGGVKGAIAKRAETVYARLDSAQQKAAEQVFTKLVRPGDETGDTRRRAELREFDPAGQSLIHTLAGPEARLLITGRDTGTNQETVEVAHEALIREWDQLRKWVGTYRSDLQARERLEQMAKDWAQGKGELVRGRQLRAFRRLRGGRAAPGQRAEKYLKASLWRSLRRIAAGSLAALVLIGGLGVFNLWIYGHEMSPVMGFYVLTGMAGWILKKPEMVEVRPGEGGFSQSFWMGSPEDEPERRVAEGPRHEVTFAKPFAIGRSEVTFEEYELFARLTGREVPSDEGWGTGDRPVINVTWEDAAVYAQWLKEETGKSYRLPSEVEWEYAARAGTETPFSTGDCIHTDQANYNGNFGYNDCGAKTGVRRGKTVATGSLPPNPWGLHEMHGNVSEWVQDCWHGGYPGAPTNAQAWEDAGGGVCGRRVIRGGAWGGIPGGLRSAFRYGGHTAVRNFDIGFRLAQDL